MAIKDIFNRRTPIDRAVIGLAGRYAIVRGSFPSSTGIPCRYGIFIPGADATPLTDDGIVLTFDEISQLAELLPGLVAAGKVRQTTPTDEYEAKMAARDTGKKATNGLW